VGVPGATTPPPSSWLHLPDSAAPWIAELAAGPQRLQRQPPLQLTDMNQRLTAMDITPGDRGEVRAVARQIEQDPGLHWLCSRAGSALATMREGVDNHGGEPAPTPGSWSPLTGESEQQLHRWFWVVVFAMALPELRRWHAAHGVDPTVSDVTVADVGAQVAAFRRLSGHGGLDQQRWLTLVFGGRLLRLSRLQVEVRPPGAATTALAAAGLPGDTPVAAAHIPATGGPLTPDSVDEFLASVPAASVGLTGVRPLLLTCDSWLLDPQLSEHLRPDSNIVAFGRRFQLLPLRPQDTPDDDVRTFAFTVPPATPIAELPRDSSLRRSLADHLAGGGHWWSRRGWLRLPDPDGAG